MNDLGEASLVLGIEIHRDGRKGVLGLSLLTVDKYYFLTINIA
jgi:hypothetical protein